MDIYCRHCGEPWDLDTLHDEVTERCAAVGQAVPRLAAYDVAFRAVREGFTRNGCGELWAFTGISSAPKRCGNAASDPRMADASAVLGELLGDDVDGLAAMLDDYARGY